MSSRLAQILEDQLAEARRAADRQNVVDANERRNSTTGN